MDNNRSWIHWDAQTVKLHLLKKGFVKNYYVWNRHGEPYIARESAGQSSTGFSNISTERDEDNLMYNMVMDVAGPNFDPHSEEIPNVEAQKLYDMLHSSERELYDGCETSQLSAMACMLSLKSDHHLSETCYDETSQFIKSVLPEDNTCFDSFYNTKKHMAGLGLPSVKIDCCVNGCMIYWGEDIDMESSCPHCAHDHDSYNLSHGGKPTWFDSHRKFLPVNHPFRKNKNWFTKGKTVSDLAPPIRTGEDVLQEIESLGLMKITELGSEEHNAKIIKAYKCGWKKRRRAHGCVKTRYLDDREYMAAHNYILFNCPEVAPYVELREQNPDMNGAEIDRCLESDFATWFKHYAQDASLVLNEYVRDLASGPLRSVRSVPIYYVNGYKFHTRTYGANKSTFNSGVCIKGSNYSETSNDYFGILDEILIIEYPRLPIKKTALFKCEWFDPTINVGTRVHQRYNIVEINRRKRLSVYEPFILAMQATQVYFCNYPSLRRDKVDWLVVCKIKARHLVDMPQVTESRQTEAFQDDIPEHLNMIHTDDILTRLNHVDGTSIDLDDDDEGSPEEETQIDSDEEDFSNDSDNYDDKSDGYYVLQFANDFLYTDPVKMRSPLFQAPQRSPEQASQRSPDQASHRSPDQAHQCSPDQASQRSPDQALHQTQHRVLRTPELTLQSSTPELALHNTPDNTPHNIPESEPNMPDESSLITNNDVWEVGTMHTDGRLCIEVIKGLLEPSCKCSHQITSIMHERLEPTGFTWKTVSKDTKEFYFEEFKKWFVWKQPDNIMYKAFLKNAAIRYKDLRSRARAHWETKPELSNRIGRDAEKWKRNPSPIEVFEHLHTKNHDNVTYIDKKSAAIAENIKTLRAERSKPADGLSVPQPVNEIMLYYDAIGGRNKRNRVYGIGSSVDIFYEPNGNTSSHFCSLEPNTQKYQKLETKLQEMKEQLKEMDEMKQRMREMESLVARLVDNENR
ncbi:hypothetical protein POM88_035636 [Heracleum sosnowskyi]|uniref:DUF4216 domain-containing protein n=1 Tax=Heracleum sosnowskyi TaxID=360622 RepID=A0AAD8ME98_9APIA|nr:hypothetical protein POM88_035636 [Heracleum sosnowskyi]